MILFGSTGAVAARLVLDGINPNTVGIPRAVQTLVQAIDAMLAIQPRICACFIGAAGFGTGNNADTVRAALEARYADIRFRCVSDMYNCTAWAKADEKTVCAICGTGGVVFVHEDGALHRLGGYGAYLDRAGSGYDIGRMALLTALEEQDGIGRRSLITPLVEEKIGGRVFDVIATLHQRGVSYIASFAPLVFEADAMGDEQAGEILDTNAARLADLINCAHENFAPVGKTLVVSGSIFYQKAFLDRVRERLHYDFDVMPTDMPPVYGACILCCRMSGVNENAIAERLRCEYKSVTEE